MESLFHEALNGPNSIGAIAMILFVYGFLFAMTLLPVAILLIFLMNRKFDRLLGPKPGEAWEVGKRQWFPYYPVHRMRDYAWAMIWDWYARRKFRHPKTFLQAQVGLVTRLLCAWYALGEISLGVSILAVLCAKYVLGFPIDRQ